MSMNLANLPGVGKVVDPTPKDYRAAIAWLTNDHPWRGNPTYDPRYKLAVALSDTLRRIEWQRAGRQAARAAA